ncbi:transcriptional regulator/antitoxin, MazE [mine drainage metagenome]|uniref:Transcriptional regulator/antitoxin, MazE n=1 Tax=mine drainage metagenome TaxID=410659 RepID=T1CWA0_9ZZZZ
MQAVTLTIRAIGNSKGIVLPKPVLAQIGLEGASNVAMTVEHGAIVLRKPAEPVRAGWAEAAQSLAAQGDDELIMGEFGNQNDTELAW